MSETPQDPQRELQQAKEDLARIFRLLPDRYFRVDRRGTILEAGSNNGASAPSGNEHVGRSLSEAAGKIAGAMLQRAADECIGTDRRVILKFEGENSDAGRLIEAVLLPLSGQQAAILLRDITHDTRIELQYRNAQKMEAIGHLAGGIAHDINNLLMVVLGNIELLSGGKKITDPEPELAAIQEATERGVALISQLLAFGRRQILHPRVLDLNEIILQTAKLLSRVIGANIRIETALAADLGHIFADAAQIDQVIMNLAVNARDAMTPGGGTLLFATSNMNVAENAPIDGIEIPPGDYVALSVTDTGHGIAPEILSHIFEPFFTTKKTGKGSGLGLATVYGIVKQSHGFVTVVSEQRRGTTFRILLPRCRSAETTHGEHTPATATTADELRGNETILLVEDEEPIRKLCATFLTRNGYRIIAAGSGEEALGLLARKPDAIDLLLTDVVMPGIHGGELARRVVRQRPGTRILFMSGHPDETIEAAGIDASGANYLPKPFRGGDLIRKVRTILDEPPSI